LRSGEKYLLLFDSPSDFDKSHDKPASLGRAEPAASVDIVRGLMGPTKALDILKARLPDIYAHLSIVSYDAKSRLLAALVQYTDSARIYVVDEARGTVSVKWVNGKMLKYNQITVLGRSVTLRWNTDTPLIWDTAEFLDIGNPAFKTEIDSGGNPGEFRQ